YKAIGIGDRERRERNLSFHSWRHFANSLFVSKGIPLLEVQSLIGHSSVRMTNHYFHAQFNTEAVRAAQESLFDDSPAREPSPAPIEVEVRHVANG
ncbi:MAG: tyrosine-type recombinase/integrase, partial [Leptospiraceae bacterium]|nr:tyrosine-type recombinase/integrase [Leptospiraceae bacterium]